MTNHLHIVCLDAPAPPDYGGAIDMYYKILALHKSGKNITLHYFDYNNERNAISLRDYCLNIFSYARSKWLFSFPLKPYIISSRINRQLIDRLNADNAPILLEGIHCTGILPYLKGKERRVIIRIHNDEAVYYSQLAKAEKGILKKLYFSLESRLLKQYQKKLPLSATYAFLSSADVKLFTEKYKITTSAFIPCFLAWQTVQIKQGLGSYCLYHGNLSVAENEEAALWLINHVFSKVTAPLVIAGKGISKDLSAAAERYAHIRLVSNPTIKEIDNLIEEAHIHVLPSLNKTGVKLKLLHALFRGRFCVTNLAGVEGSHINNGVYLAEKAEEFISLINYLMNTPFTQEQLQQREALLQLYNNDINAQKLSALL